MGILSPRGHTMFLAFPTSVRRTYWEHLLQPSMVDACLSRVSRSDFRIRAVLSPTLPSDAEENDKDKDEMFRQGLESSEGSDSSCATHDEQSDGEEEEDGNDGASGLALMDGTRCLFEIPKLPVDLLLTPTGLEVRERKPCILDTSTSFEMGEGVVDLDALTSFPAKIPYGAIKRVALRKNMVALFVRVLPSQSRRSSGEPQRRIWVRAPHSSSSIQLLVNVLSNIIASAS